MTAIVDTKKIMDLESMKKVFEKYDDDNSGALDHDQIQSLFRANKLMKKLVRKEEI